MANESSMQKTIFAFAGGGTGGHLFPALAVIEALKQRCPNAQILFLATNRTLDRRILDPLAHIDPHHFTWIAQDLPVMPRHAWSWPRFFYRIRTARYQARTLLLAHNPEVVVGTGGLGSVPVVQAAFQLGISSVLLNPDAVPGRANRFLARHTKAIVAQWPDVADLLPPSVPIHPLGCPIRSAFLGALEVDRSVAMRHFDLDPSRKTLLVTGASQGARTINQTVLANLDFLSLFQDWQVLHLAGEADFDDVRTAYSTRNPSLKTTVLPFTESMPQALGVADLVVSRAGASTLAELCVMGCPSVLMPYPFHRDQHQTANAKCLERAGAAVILDDAKDAALNGPRLQKVLQALMHDSRRRASMAAAAKSLAKPDAASETAKLLLEYSTTRLVSCSANRSTNRKTSEREIYDAGPAIQDL